MPMVDKTCIDAIEGKLKVAGFDLDNAPKTKELISIIVTEIIAQVKLANVITPMGPGSLQ